MVHQKLLSVTRRLPSPQLTASFGEGVTAISCCHPSSIIQRRVGWAPTTRVHPWALHAKGKKSGAGSLLKGNAVLKAGTTSYSHAKTTAPVPAFCQGAVRRSVFHPQRRYLGPRHANLRPLRECRVWNTPRPVPNAQATRNGQRVTEGHCSVERGFRETRPPATTPLGSSVASRQQWPVRTAVVMHMRW